ncbi:MAG: crotonase/enoyl-CoA hydratase family protein [Gammaproteobacteria bacterium]|nr:crotonase/enoyl-CoA hydratase family protein [Gammaproteobacteria bacterium]
MTYATLATDLESRILTITLNRPEAMNSFTVEMAGELVDAFNSASEDDDVGCIIVTGAGKAFCAGMDLSIGGNVFGLDESIRPNLDEVRRRYNDEDMVTGVRDTGGRVSLAIFECKKPVIGAINGAAVGIGATMTLGMDIRMVSEKARIGFVFGKIGVTPEACSTWFLPRIVGMQTALEWVYSADILNASQVVDAGLARSAHAPEELLPAARELALKFVANRSPVAIALARQMMYRNSAMPSPRTAHEVDSLSMYYSSLGDGKEGVQSFLEKRDPVFASKASVMPDFYPWWESEQ